jgi:ABC-type transport system involved in Fe-S cluster assembly fused permease/ATPase subunit
LYSLFVLTIIDSNDAPTIVHFVTWAVALVGEILLLITTIILYTSPHKEFNSIKTMDGRLKHANNWEITELVFDSIRVLLLILCTGLYGIFTHNAPSSVKARNSDTSRPADERTPLLNDNSLLNSQDSESATAIERVSNGTAIPEEISANGNANGVHENMNGHANGNSNGRVHPAGLPPGPAAPADTAAFYRPTTAAPRSWWEYIRGYSLFFPYLWPQNSTHLQVTVVICFILVLLQRVVNAVVPYQFAAVLGQLEASWNSASTDLPWLGLLLFMILKILQGGSGVLGAARSVLWIPVSQFSYQALSTAAFEHVHGLSLEFHLGKRTGEVLSALSKGASINTFLEQVTFQVLPMLVDLGVAVVVFAAYFDAYYALTVGIITFWYMYLTIRMAQWRAEQRRRMVNADREEDAVKNDSISSYETVKYFGAEDYEFDRYRTAVVNYQKEEYSVLLSLNVMNITQMLVFMVGLLVLSFIAAYQVTTGQREPRDFVMMMTYMNQLQQPLNYFGTFYRSVQSAMISGERLLELFKEQPTVIDEPTAEDLPNCEGAIRFENVKFSYDTRKPALESLSFTCPPGTTTALVGESGGGKSTVFRLLFRFYNFQNGSIQLDGHDVRDLTIKSLRSHIGVVPQDTVLFNETLMYNLRYANQDATDEDIYDACRAASIHDKILTFPDKYQTKVGERGLRLSGGEKQRVAIARTILKNPRIIMLDEATAALDTETEQNIQEAFKTLSQGRTMLVIA